MSTRDDRSRHPLLARQIQRVFGTAPLPEDISRLLDGVDHAYRENDRDRAMLERALEISSRELIEANSQMRAMLQASPDLFLHVGLDGTVIDHKEDPIITLFCAVNGASARLTLKAGLLEPFRTAIEALAEGLPVASFDLRPSGGCDERIFEIRVVMLFRDQAVIYIRDVTEQRRADIQLHESEERYRSLFDSSPHPMWVYDVETLTFLAVNMAALRQYGYSSDEFLAMTLKDIRPPDEVPGLLRFIAENPENAIPEGQGIFRHRRKDGSEIDVEIASSAILFRGREAGLVLATDVTEKRRLQAEQESMSRQLEQARRISALGNVAATMAHEFNNVLMGIQPFIEIIARQTGDSPRVQTAVARVNSAIKRGKGVTSEILRYTRQTPIVRKPVVVDGWLTSLVDEARAVLRSEVTLQVHSSSGLVVSGDASHLQQLFLNLITNARDAISGTGAIVLDIRGGAGSGHYPFGVVDGVESFAHFTVADNGQGMSADTRAHLFEAFFTTKKNGTGIGMALSRRIVQQHGGHIFVESQEGVGTAVHVFLPNNIDEHPQPEIRPAVIPPAVQRLAIIDDDLDVVAGLTALLTLEGIDVVFARNGAEAIPTIERTSPDAVLLDVGLPDVDGVTVYKQIRERWPTLPVIFATGHADLSRVSDLSAKPHVASLRKPFEWADLVKALEVVLSTPPGTAAMPPVRASCNASLA
ncbi:MAG TPA: ATP-binding protein [Thermoanaerobaculia bacterium]|nr:ATP-binding protein [Thermoanaerobaculia bacterium]